MSKKRIDISGSGKASGGINKSGLFGRQEDVPSAADSHRQTSSSTVSFPVVGIGASSGGLAALEDFFAAMPVDRYPDMTFVVVQHLSPDQVSDLPKLIRKHTRMPVCTVEDGMAVQPNTIYIIPANRDLIFQTGTLQLMKPRTSQGRRMSVDIFFRSLAEDQRERSIGIILSGTGTDGTLGMQAIKAAGGMVMVQEPESAEFEGMPNSAIATGLADYELAPSQMPARLTNYAGFVFDKAPLRVAAPAGKKQVALKKIFHLLNDRSGQDFSCYKPTAVERRIERRMAVNQIETIEGYEKFVQHQPEELDELFHELLIGVTGFFRDPAPFRYFEEKVIPALFAGMQNGSEIRVWVPGCATGEEAYSIAILLAEYQEKMKRSYNIQIFGTDIDRRALATARSGLYPVGIAADVSPERLAKYFSFEPDANAYRIKSAIREMVVFAGLDLIKDPPFTRLDLISCRNVLIYMDENVQEAILSGFHRALKDCGFLFLGNSETAGRLPDLFTSEGPKHKIYRRKETFKGMPRTGPSGHSSKGTYRRAPYLPSDVRGSVSAEESLREMTERALLMYMDATAALVNEAGDILYLHGRAGKYLELPAGETGINNIHKMAREDLRRKLATGLHQAVEKQTGVTFPRLRTKTIGGSDMIKLTIRPLEHHKLKKSEATLFLIVFENEPHPEHEESLTVRESVKVASDTVLTTPEGQDARLQPMISQDQLDNEEYIRTISDKLKVSIQDLKFSQEDRQSMNKELKSINEEIGAARMEAQSLNAELSAVNTELEAKKAQLVRANNDLQNLMDSTNTGIIFVNREMCVFRYNEAVKRIIDLLESDLGRALNHIPNNLAGSDTLAEVVKEVLKTLQPREIKVQTKDKERYMVRIKPYRTLENVTEGAVIAFERISPPSHQ